VAAWKNATPPASLAPAAARCLVACGLSSTAKAGARVAGEKWVTTLRSSQCTNGAAVTRADDAVASDSCRGGWSGQAVSGAASRREQIVTLANPSSWWHPTHGALAARRVDTPASSDVPQGANKLPQLCLALPAGLYATATLLSLSATLHKARVEQGVGVHLGAAAEPRVCSGLDGHTPFEHTALLFGACEGALERPTRHMCGGGPCGRAHRAAVTESTRPESLSVRTRVWKAATSKAHPRQQQDWFLKCQQGG
jgi:hypothetical protein